MSSNPTISAPDCELANGTNLNQEQSRGTNGGRTLGDARAGKAPHMPISEEGVVPMEGWAWDKQSYTVTSLFTGIIMPDGSLREVPFGNSLDEHRQNVKRQRTSSPPKLNLSSEHASPSPLELDNSQVQCPAAHVLTYGSEDDSDFELDDEIDDVPIQPRPLPKSQRMYFDIEDDEVYDTSVQAPEPPTELTPTDAVTHLPKSLFDFEWRTFLDPSVDPTERREVFSEINCGPTAQFLSPYDAFVAIWSRDFMEYIAAETNRYAQELVEKQEGSLRPESRITGWKETNADELYVFFGMLVGTSLCIKGDIEEYWSEDELIATPYFAQIMTRDRFMLLARCLHFNKNPSDITRLSRYEAKLHKIRPVVDHLNSRFQSLYRLGRDIVLDESLTRWNGWRYIERYIVNSAAVGIKTCEVCEAQTGYLWRFKVHAGREEVAEHEVTPVSDATSSLVLQLLKGLEHKGRTVWMDSHYSSPALARVLKTLGFDCVGTLRTSRQCVPRQLSTLQKSDMTVGQISGYTSGDVDILVWRDIIRVAMISTYHGDAVHTVAETTEPTAFYDYNLCMGGVDKKDQMLCRYPLVRKGSTKVWYKKLFWRLLNVSVWNSFILYKNSVRRITVHRVFRKVLIQQLLDKHRVMESYDMPGVSRERTSTGPPQALLLTEEQIQHLPLKYGYHGLNKKRTRGHCVECYKLVSYYCPACNVTMCLDCSYTFHRST